MLPQGDCWPRCLQGTVFGGKTSIMKINLLFSNLRGWGVTTEVNNCTTFEVKVEGIYMKNKKPSDNGAVTIPL